MKKSRKTLARLATAAMSIGWLSQAAMGIDRTWNGFTSTQFSLNTNWIGSVIPGINDSAYLINHGSVTRSVVNVTASQTIRKMFVQNVPATGAFEFQRSNSSLLTIDDTLQFEDAGSVNLNGANLSATFTNVYGNSTINLNNNAQLETGLLYSRNVNSILNVNSGTVLLDGNMLIDAGTLNLNAGGTINIASGLISARGAGGFTGRININTTYSLQPNREINAILGGDIVATDYMDIGAQTGTGKLFVDGAGSSVVVGTNPISAYTDWGKSANITFAHSATGDYNRGLQIAATGTGTSAVVNLETGASLNVDRFLITGTGTSTISITAATLTSTGTTQFGANTTILLTSGALNLGGNATFLTGATLTRFGGSLTFAPSTTLAVNGGFIDNVGGGYALSNGVTVNVTRNGTTGGRFNNDSYVDIANGAATGTLLVDGAGSQYTTAGATASDWGANAGNSATVTFSNSGAGTITGLRMSRGGGTSQLNLLSGAQLSVGSLQTGTTSGANVNVTINGGTLNLLGTASFLAGTTLNLQGGGLALGGDASLSTGATLNWSGGRLGIAGGKTLTLAGGQILATTGSQLTNNATLRISANGLFNTSTYYDMASSDSDGGIGTLIVDGANARFVCAASPGNFSIWAANSGDAGTFDFSNGGAGTLSGGLQVAPNGGIARINISSNASLTVAGLGTGSPTGTASINISSGSLNSVNNAGFGNGTAINVTGTGLLRLGGDSTFSTGSTFNGSSSATNSGLNWADATTLAFDGGSGTIAAIGSGIPNNGSLRIANGGSLTAVENFNIGNGTLLVSGPGSKLIVNNTTSPTNFWGIGGTKTVEFINGGAGTLAGAVLFASSGGAGTLNVTGGGTLQTGNFLAGQGAAATINIIGGTLRATGQVQLGVGGVATVNIGSGGLFQTDSGVFTTFAGGTATINVNGGTLRTTGASNVNGGTTLNFASGTVNIGGTLGVGSANPNARVLLTPGGDKTLRVGGLDIPGANGGKVDLSNNSMIVDHTGISPIDTIRGYLQTGRNGGNWLGNGVTSSAAAGSLQTALGYVEASSIGSPATFNGYSIDNTTVLVDYTWYGDANLDGKVNTIDFNNLAGNFGGSSKVWFNGDFNYDGNVDSTDFTLLVGSYGRTTPPAAPLPGPQGGAQLGSVVPEPTCLIAVALLPLLTRRRPTA